MDAGLFVAVLLASVTVSRGTAFAEEPPSPVHGRGRGLYVTHCAMCHGDDGKGAGPAAAALKTRPPDLTQIRRAHDGKFPRAWVVGFIDGESPSVSHGSREMPVWGHVFRWKEGDFGARAQVYALADYVESIQQK